MGKGMGRKRRSFIIWSGLSMRHLRHLLPTTNLSPLGCLSLPALLFLHPYFHTYHRMRIPKTEKDGTSATNSNHPPNPPLRIQTPRLIRHPPPNPNTLPRFRLNPTPSRSSGAKLAPS